MESHPISIDNSGRSAAIQSMVADEVFYLRTRLVQLDAGWRDSYMSYQTRVESELDYLRNELRIAVAKNVEQERKHKHDKERSDMTAFVLGLVVGIAISTAAAIFLLMLAGVR